METSETKNVEKCYNHFSCVISVLIIVFVLGSILWDLFITKPVIKDNITEIKTELVSINHRLSTQDSLRTAKLEAIQIALNKKLVDTIHNEQIK